MLQCRLQKTTSNVSYGFDLRDDERGTYIGRVGRGLMAYRAGIRDGYRIVAVNGADMSGAGKETVGAMIKQEPQCVDLVLVIEPDA